MEDNDNIWQASKYLSNSNTYPAFVPIPELVTTENECVTKNHEIAATLLAKFFPPLPKYLTPMVEDRSNQLTTLPITEEKIQNAIFQASPLKGAGHDCIPALVWQKTWPILKDFVIPLFECSLQQGKLSDTWKLAKILPLKKPNKGNYMLLGAYCPISLLPTLNKALEYLVAPKLAHLCDAHDLLPGNHFSGLKCKSILDALVVLQEKVY